MPVLDATTARIRALNDALRCENKQGTILLTSGVAALPPVQRVEILAALARFDSFDAGDDPYGEHDFGAFTVGGDRLLFKIDAYDLSGTVHSPDPAEPAVTRRVLTLMLAAEY